MRGLPYYEEPEYHEYLLSPERKDLFPHEPILSQISWKGKENILDFGMGNGYFLPGICKYRATDAVIWGAECQELLIDTALQLKVKEAIDDFTPFYVERTEHPLLPDWIPEMDLVFCSCVLSTFADPSLAMRGISRIMHEQSVMIVIDWEKKEAPSGPGIEQKISKERMVYFSEDAGLQINRELKINEYVYGFEATLKEKKEASDGGDDYLTG